jgi:hypothetical protein
MIVSRREEIIESGLQFCELEYYDTFHNLAHTTRHKKTRWTFAALFMAFRESSRKKNRLSLLCRVPQHLLYPDSRFVFSYS